MNSRQLLRCALACALCIVLTSCTSTRDATPVASSTGGPSPSAAPATPAPSGNASAGESASSASPELGTVEPSQPSPPDTQGGLSVEAEIEIDLALEGIFARATDALQALNSYRFRTSFIFTSEEDGNVESGSIELSGDIMDGSKKHFVWRDLADESQFEVIQLDDQAWVFDDGKWTSVPSLVADAMSQGVLVFAPSVVWAGVFGSLEASSSYVGKETVNGVAVHHYTSAVQQWEGYWQGDLLDASGDVWIAEAGYPIRYAFTAVGIDEEGHRGLISWTMDLTDVGGNVVIEPPL